MDTFIYIILLIIIFDVCILMLQLLMMLINYISLCLIDAIRICN